MLKNLSTVMSRLLYLSGILALVTLATQCSAEDDNDAPKSKPIPVQTKAPDQPMKKVEKTDAEWREQLTPEQYRITRQAGTERPGGDVYKQFKKQGKGTYFCVACGNKLFHSNTKFDSGCGWPSFYDPADAEGITEKEDASLGMARVEVVCSKCDAHLGHVFRGEGHDVPTDARYCINGIALLFVPAKGEEPAKPSE